MLAVLRRGAAALLAWILYTSSAPAQSYDLADLERRAAAYRAQAGQSAEDYQYFADRRARCGADDQCVEQEYQVEMSELQMRLANARRPEPQLAGAPNQIAPVANLRNAGADLRSLLDQVVATDSRGWMINRYDRGSMRNVRILDRAANNRSMVVYGEYNYNGGAVGWVRARVVDGAFSCVEYWDFAGSCRPIGSRSYAYGLAAGLAAAALAGAIVSGGSSSAGSDGVEPGSYAAFARDSAAQRNNERCSAGGGC